jgi:plasmid replication initiation protein
MEYDTLDNLSRKSLVVKGNPLIEARFDELSSVEYKIIIAALSKIKPSDTILDFISFETKEFCDLLKIQKRGMYKHLKESCNKLIKRTITIEKTQNNWEKFSWLFSIKYESGTIRLKFHPYLEPYLLYCKENRIYTKYLLENVIDMDRKYSIRIYELTKQYEKIGYRIFTVNELKQLIGIPLEKYPKFTFLRKRVLEPSREEVNGLTDINIDFEEIKEGRKINKVKYLIQPKKFNMNTSQYELIPKLKLISVIRKRIYELSGSIIDFKTLNKYHRIVLIELIKKFDSGVFNKVLIKHPKNFFIWHLNDINQMFDLSNKEDY